MTSNLPRVLIISTLQMTLSLLRCCQNLTTYTIQHDGRKKNCTCVPRADAVISQHSLRLLFPVLLQAADASCNLIAKSV